MAYKSIGQYTARLYGPRGVQVILPKAWLEANGVKPKDKITFHVDPKKPDRLLLIAEAK